MRTFLSVAAWLVVLGGAGYGAEPDPASSVPADAVVFASVRDVRQLVVPFTAVVGAFDEERARAAGRLLRQTSAIITGRVTVAVSVTPQGRAELFLRAPVDESKRKVDDLFLQQFKIILGKDNFRLDRRDGLRRIVSPDERRPLVCWTVRDKVLYVSEAEHRVARVVHPPPEPVRMLADTAEYRRLGKHVNWTADVTAFVNTGQLARRWLRPAAGEEDPDRATWLSRWLALDQFEAVGFSLGGDGKTGSGRLAVITPPERRGVAALFDAPNVPLDHLHRLPADCLSFASLSFPRGHLARTARFLRGLDPEVGKEFEDELAEFSKELGVDLQKDLVDNVRAVACGYSMLGGDHNVATVRDSARFNKAVEALAAYNKTPLKKYERGGRVTRIVPFKLPAYYTFDGKQMLFSTRFDAIQEMLALAKGGREGKATLADSKTFQKLRARLPKECFLLLAVDMRRLAQMARLLLSWVPDLRRSLPPGFLEQVIGPFRRAEPGLSLGIALRNEPGAYVLHVESLAGDPLQLIPTAVAATIAGPLEKARLEARKAHNRNQLKQIAQATMMWSVKFGNGGRKYPRSLKALLDAKIVDDPKLFLRPGSGTKLVQGRFVSDYDSAFDRAGFQLEVKDVPGATTMLAWQKAPWPDKTRDIVFFDCHVENMTETRFRGMLRDLDKWIAGNRPKKK